MSEYNNIKLVVLGTRGFPNIQGGVESHCHNLYSKLTEKGCRITVLSRRPYTGPDVINCGGVRLLPLACPKNKYTEAFFHTLRGVLVARRVRPDIVHFHAIGPSLFIPLARLLGMKVVMTHHGLDYRRAKWGWLAKTVLKLGEQFGCKYANQVIVVSSGVKKQIKKKFGKNAHLIPNGIALPERSKESIHIKSLGLTPGKYILSVARFVPEKGLHHLISAFSSLQTDWKLVIVGDAVHETTYSRQLKSQAADNSNVVLTGVVQGKILNEIYSHAALFVLPSYHEGFSIALLEALSYGLSVLVSDIAPNKEVGLEEDRYFPVGNEEALAKKLNDHISNGTLSKEEQAKQIEMVWQKYNWDNIAEQVLQVYQNTLSGER